MMSATYSPDDNKLRLYSTTRLDPELYARVKAAGFKWAPKQELFVAPMWTPGREDLLIELCGEVGDEDTSLVQRAEERAERFDEYSDKRAAEAKSAKAAVDRIVEHIPLGQPILVGHHSERRARKDAEKIGSGMMKAVKLWDTSKYWQDRAEGALAHAKYKEDPGVRHRRIKGIESDRRKSEKSLKTSQQALVLWTEEGLTLEAAVKLAGTQGYGLSIRREGTTQYDSVYSLLTQNKLTVAEAQERAAKAFSRSIEWDQRWITHYDNRLTYERTMLAQSLGADPVSQNAMAERFNIEVGGRVLARRETEWLVVLRVTRKEGVIQSVTTTAPRSVTWSKTWKYSVEEIKDYKAPEGEDAAKAKKATALAPLCNYPGEGFREMTEDEWKRSVRASDFYFITTLKATETAGRHRVRVAPTPGKGWVKQQVFLTDAKRKDAPAPDNAAPVTFEHQPNHREAPARPISVDNGAAAFEAMRQAAKAGVQVVAAPQLFPTPRELAERMVKLANIRPGNSVLEPSAGTGNLLGAMGSSMFNHDLTQGSVTAVEINGKLIERLEVEFPKTEVKHGNFLDFHFRQFDKIVMNPPFINGEDIKHIEHAKSLLAPGGTLVALCANGPRQREKLMPLADYWEDLPPGSFSEQGTNVNVALLVIEG